MAYAGIQTMLLAYKLRKTDVESQAIEITRKLNEATRNTNAASDAYQLEKAELDKDDPDYDEQLEAIQDDYKSELAKITAWEDDLEQQKSNCETEIKLLDGYISSWQGALQQNVAKAHTYGAQ